MDTGYSADRNKIAQALERQREGGGVIALFQFCKALTVGLIAAAVILAITPHHTLGELPLAYMVGPVLFALSYLVIYRASATVPASSEKIAQKSEREWQQLAGTRGVARMIFWGAAMAVTLGLTVGSILVLTLPPTDLVRGSRSMTMLAFTAGSAAWTIPAALVIRWVSIRTLERYRIPSSG